MAANSGFQISLDVRGWPVLVIGGNEEAADKVQRLLDAGAKVTVISPTLHELLRKLAASAKIIHRGRHFRANDLESVILVLNTLRDDRALAQSLIRLAREQKFLLWSSTSPMSRMSSCRPLSALATFVWRSVRAGRRRPCRDS
ncbi:MAG: NAD(P)-dependent oxidoreductase [Nitrospira sp.]